MPASDLQYDPYSGIETPDDIDAQKRVMFQKQMQAAQPQNTGAMFGAQMQGMGMGRILSNGAESLFPSPQMQQATQNKQQMQDAPTDPDQLDSYAQDVMKTNPRLAVALQTRASQLRKNKQELLESAAQTAAYQSTAGNQNAEAVLRGQQAQIPAAHVATQAEIADYQHKYGKIPTGHGLVFDEKGEPKIVGDNPVNYGANWDVLKVHQADGTIQDYSIPKGGNEKSKGSIKIGDPYDPQSGVGGTGSQQPQRVIQGGHLAAADTHNLAFLPVNSSTGLVGGLFTKPAQGPLGITAAALQNQMSSQTAQLYTKFTGGLKRNLGIIESAGLNPGKSLVDAMEQVLAHPGDSQLTMISSMAQMRQIIVEGLNGIRSHPRITPEQRKDMDSIIAQVKKDIPYTQDDVLKLYWAGEHGDDKMTLHDAMKDKGRTVTETRKTKDGRTLVRYSDGSIEQQ